MINTRDTRPGTTRKLQEERLAVQVAMKRSHPERDDEECGECMAPVPQTQTIAQIVRFADREATLHERITDLEVRLQPVTRESFPDENCGAMARERLVPYAELLCHSNDSLDGAIARINSLLDRLEV